MRDIWLDWVRIVSDWFALFKFRHYSIWLGAVFAALFCVLLAHLILKRRFKPGGVLASRGSFYLALLLAPAFLPLHGQLLICPAVLLAVVGLAVPLLLVSSLASILVTWGVVFGVWQLILLVLRRNSPSETDTNNTGDNGEMRRPPS